MWPRCAPRFVRIFSTGTGCAGDYVVSVYGYTDLVDTFTAKLAAAYPSAKTVSDDPIV